MSKKVTNEMGNDVFYKRFVALYTARGYKPTPLAREIGISPGLIKRWSEGAKVNYDTLLKIASFFKVPLDYFIDNSEPNHENEYKEPLSENINAAEEASALSVAYKSLRNHPSYIVSFVTGFEYSPYDIYRISKYMKCEIVDLIENQNEAKDFQELVEKEHHHETISTKDLLFTILNSVPGTQKYSYLQFQISRLIMINLIKGKKVSKDQLINDVGLTVSKINNLFDSIMNNDFKPSYIGFNFSDLMNTYQKFNISYDFMFTGEEDPNR